MPLFSINLGTTGFHLDVNFDDVDEGFISSFSGQFRKEGDVTVYPKLYWQVVKILVGVERIGNLAFALDVDGSTEPFCSLYDISNGVYRDQVAEEMNANPSDTYHDLLVLNGMNYEGAESIDAGIIMLAIEKIESIQTMGVGLTGYFAEDEEDDSEKFISILLDEGFQRLMYNGFVSQNAIMLFRPQSALV